MKITIIGAGIAGLTTAISLRKYRPEISLEIYEASPELRPVGAGLALAANAVLAFEQLGVRDEVLAVSNLLESFSILDASGRILSKSDNLAINHNLQTISNFAAHRADLQRILLAQIPEVPVHLGKKVSNFRLHERGVEIRFGDGSKQDTEFVIATDGIHSVFRKTLLPDSKIRYAGYTCWRGVADGKDLAGFQNLSGLRTNSASETWGLGKRFGIVPLKGGQVYWFACLNAPTQQDKTMAAFGKDDLLRSFGDLHAPIPAIIGATEPQRILWNDIVDFEPVQQFAFGQVLLLGDAAHATTPNMGQGACQAIEGAAILGKTMSQHLDPVAAFRAFEQKRLKRTALIVNRSWTLGKIAQLQNPVLASLRNLAMRLLPDSMNERQVRELLDVDF